MKSESTQPHAYRNSTGSGNEILHSPKKEGMLMYAVAMSEPWKGCRLKVVKTITRHFWFIKPAL